ncbi:MAG: ribonuclease R [bacterium]|nr:MAG: ribonuclease R [bacterium]
MIDKESVLKFFSACSRPLSFKETISQMGLERMEARQLRKILQGLVKSGELIMTRQGRYGTPEEMSLVKGYFEAHRDGYGFVIPEDPGQRDVFVPSKATLGAMEGDRVIVRIENPKKRDGRILRILERAQTRLVGTLEITKGVSFLKPKRRDIPFDIYIAPKDRKNAGNGDMVVAEILTYPTDKRPPSGKVIRILKKPEVPAEEVESIIDEFNLPRKFPADVTKSARSLSAEIPGDEPGRRKDLQKLPTVTIDGERAKDFDDAISIKLRKFGYTLYVHIADVGYYVPWESVIDREAKKRGTSVYLPDRVVPMLPKKLSEDICSLKPKVPRFAFTVEMDFNRDGVRINQRFYPSIIQSDERMTYTQVKEILVDEDRKLRERYDYLLKEFELMEELCGVMRARRLKRGSLDFDLPEPEVLLDIRGNPEAIVVAERNFAHMIIEEFMIAANEAVAENLSAMGVPSIYRIHEPPDQSKMDDILKVVKAITNIRKKHLSVKDLPYILDKARGRPEEDVVNYIVLRSLKQARYSIQNVGHFGLASECYTHFTSPIRRYSDLVVHRILREVLGRKKMKEERMKELEEALPSTAFHCSRRERIADDAERAVVAAMRAWFMKGKVGEELVARIVGVTPQGIKVRLKDFYVDGFLHVSYLTDDYYIYNERNLQLVGRRKKRRFSIGDEITVRVDKVDLDQREIIFGLPRT